MKKLSKRALRLLSLVLSLVILASFCTVAITASAADSTTVYFKNTANWSAVNAYYWSSATNSGPLTWPGTAMTDEGEGIFSINVPAGNNMIIFNNGGAQTDDLSIPGANHIFDYSTKAWAEYNPGPKMPSITASKKDGASFKGETVDVTITVTDATSASYSVDGGAAKSFTNTATVTLGAKTAYNATTTLTVTATNENGTTTKSFTYTKKESSVVGGGDGSTSPACDGYFGTNPDGKYGAKKTISVDGDKSDWEQSMLIAQGTANDDPRVYRENSMYEVPIDSYALYAAWDDSNLYLMWEMANVQDVVAPNDDYPLSQGNLFQTQNLPIFIYMYTGQGNLTNNNTATGTLWDTGITYDAYVDTVIACSTNGSNGPFIYTADDNGILDPDVLVNKNTGIKMDWGNGKTLSGELWGIDQGYGHYNNRIPGDIFDESSAWVDFYAKGHNPKYDFFYEMSIPLSSLNISASDIENNGIGLLHVMTFGTSGMDSLPYDPSMNDNADQAATMSQEFNSMEKEDADHITVPLARVGKGLSNDGPVIPTTPSEKPSEDEPGYVLCGDADFDGDVAVTDATLVQRYCAHLIGNNDTFDFVAADVDSDGDITVMDATAIQRYLAKYDDPYGIGKMK